MPLPLTAEGIRSLIKEILRWFVPCTQKCAELFAGLIVEDRKEKGKPEIRLLIDRSHALSHLS